LGAEGSSKRNSVSFMEPILPELLDSGMSRPAYKHDSSRRPSLPLLRSTFTRRHGFEGLEIKGLLNAGLAISRAGHLHDEVVFCLPRKPLVGVAAEHKKPFLRPSPGDFS
jgi:hypothetical protein